MPCTWFSRRFILRKTTSRGRGELTAPEEAKVHVVIHGRVQGVGYRFWTLDEANRRGLGGWVRNLPDGTVEAVFGGPADTVDEMVAACWRGPAWAKVTAIDVQAAEEQGLPIPFEFRR